MNIYKDVEFKVSVDKNSAKLNEKLSYKIDIKNKSKINLNKVILKIFIDDCLCLLNDINNKNNRFVVNLGSIKAQYKKTIRFKLIIVSIPDTTQILSNFAVEYYEDESMDKLKNINTSKISTEFIPSYEELVSFSSNDVDKFVQGSLNCNSCGNTDYYRLRIKLFGNHNCNNGITNNLILDNVGKRYSYVSGTANFDNNCFNPDFNTNGLFTEVYSSDENRLLKLTLLSGESCGCDSLNNLAVDENYGFKLSEIMYNIENFNNLTRTCDELNANICINQRAYLLNRCGRAYVLCNFNLLNNGNNLAQKILFKDILPENILVGEKSIFLNGSRLCSKDMYLNRNKVIIKLPDLDAGKDMNLTIVGVLCRFIRKNNFATISYVSNCFKNKNKTTIDISQKVSNVKSI